jgi:hypothetical protein
MFDRHMCYLSASRRWKADYQIVDRDILGRCHYELFPHLPERWKRAHQRGLAGEIVREEEDPYVRSDGTVQWGRWEIRPWYQADGSIGGILICSEDVTTRKLAEEELRARNAELERFNRASTGRELRMIEMKQQVNKLCLQLGQPPPYPLDFDKSPSPPESRP